MEAPPPGRPGPAPGVLERVREPRPRAGGRQASGWALACSPPRWETVQSREPPKSGRGGPDPRADTGVHRALLQGWDVGRCPAQAQGLHVGTSTTWACG